MNDSLRMAHLPKTFTSTTISQAIDYSNRALFGESVACPPQMATDSLIQMCLKEGTYSEVSECGKIEVYAEQISLRHKIPGN